MPLKDLKKRKKYHSRYMREVWYPRNRKKHIRYVKNLKKKIALFVEQYKRERVCVDCGYPGEKFPQVLDFDHRNGENDKEFEIGGWAKSVLSIKKIQKEIEKCDLVCANCHRIRTFTRKQHSSI